MCEFGSNHFKPRYSPKTVHTAFFFTCRIWVSHILENAPADHHAPALTFSRLFTFLLSLFFCNRHKRKVVFLFAAASASATDRRTRGAETWPAVSKTT